VKMTCTVAFGLTLLAPSSTELMLDSTDGIGLAATKPILPDAEERPAATPSTKCAWFR